MGWVDGLVKGAFFIYNVWIQSCIDFCLNSNLFVHLVDYITVSHMRRVSKRALQPQTSHVSASRRMQSLIPGVRRKLTNVVVGKANQQVTPTEPLRIFPRTRAMYCRQQGDGSPVACCCKRYAVCRVPLYAEYEQSRHRETSPRCEIQVNENCVDVFGMFLELGDGGQYVF